MCFSLFCNFRSCRNCSSLKEAALRGGVDGYPSAVVTCVLSLSSPSQALMKPVSHCLQQRRQSGKEEYVCLLLCTHRHCQMHLLRHTPHLSLQRNCVQSLRKILLRWKKVDSSHQCGLVFSQFKCSACCSHSWWSTYLQQVTPGPLSNAYWRWVPHSCTRWTVYDLIHDSWKSENVFLEQVALDLVMDFFFFSSLCFRILKDNEQLSSRTQPRDCKVI